MKVLAVVSNSSTLFPNFYGRSVLPVLDLAKNRGHECFLFTDDPNTFQLAKGYWKIQARNVRMSKRVAWALQSLPSAIQTQMTVLQLYWRTRKKSVIYRSHAATVPYYFTLRKFYEKQVALIVQAWKPNVIIAMPDQGVIGRSALQVARKHHVPSVTWHSALLSPHLSYDLPTSNYVCFGGDLVANAFIERGFPKNRIRVTGHVFLDPIKHIAKHGEAVLFGTENMNVPETRKFLAATIQECQRENRSLILKVHPREKPEQYTDLIPSNLSHKVVCYTPNNAPLLEESSHVVVDQSALGLEALLSGCRLISFDSGRFKFIDYVKEGAAQPFQSGFLHSPKPTRVREYIHHANVSDDGQAEERTLQVLEEICK